jgi:hypothetical protein
MRKYIFLFSLLALFLFGAIAIPARAGDHVSRGDVMALLNGWNNGRQAVSTGGALSGPFVDPFNAAILPFPFLDGAHYCEEDYLLAMLAWFTGDASSHQEAVASLSTIQQVFFIDGQPMESIRTPVKARINSGSNNEFGFNEGVILAPGDLSPGMHTFSLFVTFAEDPPWEPSITFYIDAAGTGVCQ